MKRKSSFSLMLLILAFSAAATMAHPLGNFSVNQFSRLEIEKSQIRVRQILDLAEIPTFQESSVIDADKNNQLSPAELDAYAAKIAPNYVANLVLSINGTPVQLRVVKQEIELQNGAGNLPILKIGWDLTQASAVNVSASNEINRIHFENKNNVGRVGWNEIVVNRTIGVNVFNSTAFGNALSNELREYPQDLLTAPLAERSADFAYAASSVSLPANARELQNRDGKNAAPVQKDKFAELINVPQITLPIALLGLLVAFGFGAAHALSPGHGKTVVGAYLVGSKGTLKHAAFLGLTVTITHTLGVFALGLITLFASKYFFPERLIPFLSFVSGLLVFFIGVTLFKDRLFGALGWSNKGHHAHDHSHDGDQESHSHDDFTHTHNGHTHSHQPPETVTWRSLLALGISGGLLPCPSALVLMLAAISLNRVGYGLILTLAFSVGLAATLMCVGLVFLTVGKIFDNPALSGNRIVKTLPVFSAFVIACLGAVICYNSIV